MEFCFLGGENSVANSFQKWGYEKNLSVWVLDVHQLVEDVDEISELFRIYR